MWHVLSIAIGGGVGALARYSVARLVGGWVNSLFPWGTFAANAAGSFLMGFLFQLFDTYTVSPYVKGVLTIGFLGAFTTFSTFSLETVNLLRDGELRTALFNVLISVTTGLVLVYAGMFAARGGIQLLRTR